MEHVLRDDARNLKVQLEELLQDLNVERCDVVKYVRLAKAKKCYEQVFPEARRGKRKDPKSGSLAFADYAAKKTGWSRASISDWASIGEHIAEGAFREMRGTTLGNRHGLLKQLSGLAPPEQLRVANIFRVGFEREARRLLARLHEDHRRQVAASGDQAMAAPSVEDSDEVIIPKSLDGIECILRGHILRLHDESAYVRVRFLGLAARPHVLAMETWADGAHRAATTLRAAGYEVEVLPIDAVIESDNGTAVARHVIKLRVSTIHLAVIVFVTRWPSTPGHPLYYPTTSVSDLRRHDGPVVIVSRGAVDRHGPPLGIGLRADIAADIERAVVSHVAAHAKEERVMREFRAKALSWFRKHAVSTPPPAP